MLHLIGGERCNAYFLNGAISLQNVVCLCIAPVFSKMPLYVIGRALGFLLLAGAVMGVWVGSGEEVPARAADASKRMEITFHNSNNHTKISRRSLIFIEHNTSHAKHSLEWLKKKKRNYKFTWRTSTQVVGADLY